MIGPEFNLAVACCRHSFSGVTEDVAAAARHVDWTSFIHLVERHRIHGIASKSLRQSDTILPPDVSDAISGSAIALGARNLRSAVESKRISDHFAAASIPVLFVKGLTLSALAYGDAFLKMSCDIDILIETGTLREAAQILTQLGYRPTVPSVADVSTVLLKWHARLKESVWVSPDTGVIVELHTRLADNPTLIPEIGMGSQRQAVPIGHRLVLETLNTEDLFAYLCVHGASSAWFRLKWISDLAALLHRCGKDDVKWLYEAAEARGAGRAPAQALLVAEHLSLICLPADLRRKIERDPANRLLASIAIGALVKKAEPTQRRLGTASIHLSQPLLRGGVRFKIAELARQARDVSFRTWGLA